jgi:hypothetical protein
MIGKLLFRVAPVAAVIWAVRSGAVDAGRYLRCARNVVRVLQTRVELGTYARALANDRQIFEAAIPSPSAFSDWLRTSVSHADGRPPELDQWGKAYRLDALEDGFVISSDGPDGVRGTEDDLVERVEGLSRSR